RWSVGAPLEPVLPGGKARPRPPRRRRGQPILEHARRPASNTDRKQPQTDFAYGWAFGFEKRKWRSNGNGGRATAETVLTSDRLEDAFAAFTAHPAAAHQVTIAPIVLLVVMGCNRGGI